MKRQLSPSDGSETLRRLTERVPHFAASPSNDLSQGILRFGTEKDKSRKYIICLEFDLINYPIRVNVFRKVLGRYSGRPLCNFFKWKIVKITEDHSYINDKGKVIRNNLIALKPNKVRYNLSDLDHSKKVRPLTPASKQPNTALSSPAPEKIKSKHVHISQRRFIIGFSVVREVRSRTIGQKFQNSGRYVLD